MYHDFDDSILLHLHSYSSVSPHIWPPTRTHGPGLVDSLSSHIVKHIRPANVQTVAIAFTRKSCFSSSVIIYSLRQAYVTLFVG